MGRLGNSTVPWEGCRDQLGQKASQDLESQAAGSGTGRKLAGSHIVTLLQDVVSCVGGMGALLPLLERVAERPQEAEAGPAEIHDLVGPELTSGHNTQGLLLPLGKSSGETSGAWIAGREPLA